MATLNYHIKNREDVKNSSAKWGRVCGAESPFPELESLLATCFKQARASSAVISSAVLRERVLHIATRLHIEVNIDCNGQIDCMMQDVVCTTVVRMLKCRLFSSGGMQKGTGTQNY